MHFLYLSNFLQDYQIAYIRYYRLLIIIAIFYYSILLWLELEVQRLALLLADGELSGVRYSGDCLWLQWQSSGRSVALVRRGEGFLYSIRDGLLLLAFRDELLPVVGLEVAGLSGVRLPASLNTLPEVKPQSYVLQLGARRSIVLVLRQIHI